MRTHTMDAALPVAFFAAAVPTFFTPGPNNLMLMASSAKFGLFRTVPHMLGICVGFPLMVFVIGLGLGEVFTQYPWLKTVLKYVEAAAFQWVNPKAWAMAVSFVALVVEPGDDRIITLALLSLGCLMLGPFSSFMWMAFGDQLERLLRRTGTERFLGVILAGLMLVAVVLFLL